MMMTDTSPGRKTRPVIHINIADIAKADALRHRDDMLIFYTLPHYMPTSR